jgi:hypothetical protein
VNGNGRKQRIGRIGQMPGESVPQRAVMESERPREANASRGRSPPETSRVPRSVGVAIGSGRFSCFRLFLKNTFALDAVSKRFVWMVAEAALRAE